MDSSWEIQVIGQHELSHRSILSSDNGKSLSTVGCCHKHQNMKLWSFLLFALIASFVYAQAGNGVKFTFCSTYRNDNFLTFVDSTESPFVTTFISIYPEPENIVGNTELNITMSGYTCKYKTQKKTISQSIAEEVPTTANVHVTVLMGGTPVIQPITIPICNFSASGCPIPVGNWNAYITQTTPPAILPGDYTVNIRFQLNLIKLGKSRNKGWRQTICMCQL